MCVAFACTTVLSIVLVTYATDAIINESSMDDSAETNANDASWITEENGFEDIEVTYQQSFSYTVTIPKVIALEIKK